MGEFTTADTPSFLSQMNTLVLIYVFQDSIPTNLVASDHQSMSRTAVHGYVYYIHPLNDGFGNSGFDNNCLGVAQIDIDAH